MSDDFGHEEFLVRLGKRIAKVRRSKGYSQDRLSLEASLARGTLSRIEAGQRDPRASTLAKLAEVLEVPVGKFFEMGRR